MITLLARSLAACSAICAGSIFAQNLALPPRPANALGGDAFAQKISSLDLDARDRTIADEFLAGNAPDFLRKFCPVNVTNVSDGMTNVGTFFVAPDYLAIGSDTNYFFAPISPDTAQRIADNVDCVLPTPRMVDAIYTAAPVKLAPSPIPPSPAMTTVPVFVQHNKIIWEQRMALTNLYPLGALVAGHKKDVVISQRLTVSTNNIAIYGWERTNGVPIQPLYLGHAWWWVDYSQCIRLVARTMFVNGKGKSVAEVLGDPKLCGLISDEGVVTNARYRTHFAWPDKINLPWPERFAPAFNGFPLLHEPNQRSLAPQSQRDSPSPRPSPAGRGRGGMNPRLSGGVNDDGDSAVQCELSKKSHVEWAREIETMDGVRIFIDAPPPKSFSTGALVELVFYALPNGNTIEETIGRKLSPGAAIESGAGKSGQSGNSAPPRDDWRFDIQHIGAQTRWLRQVITNKAIVVTYLQADTKSWPAWRKMHPDGRIVEILDEVCGIFASNRMEIALTSHSGGGGLVFGYLNAMKEIPAKVRRIAFLDSDYDYDSALDARKFIHWLAASGDNQLCVLAYQDYLALYNGKPFVSEAGGTWGRSRAMMEDLSKHFSFIAETNSGIKTAIMTPDALPYGRGSVSSSGLEIYSTTNRQIEFLLKENPDRKILHTVQVERNGFIQAMVSGTPLEGRGYQYLGERAYTNWIEGY